MEATETRASEPMWTLEESPTLSKLAAALAKAQGAIEPALKDSNNPHFGSKYADLASIREVSRKPLADNELCYFQRIRRTEMDVIVQTTLLHSSGEFIRGDCELPVVQRTPQAVGSSITYGRRFGLAALLGIVADEDDDGNAALASGQSAPRAQRREPPPKEAKKPEEPKKPTLSPAQRVRVLALWKAAQKKGMDADVYQAWATRLLGVPKPSSEWTAEDIQKIEDGWQEEELRTAETKPMMPPPAEREPGSDDAAVPPAPLALAGAPDPVDVLLAELGQVDSKADVEKLRQRSLDLVPSAHPRREEVSKAMVLAQARVRRG